MEARTYDSPAIRAVLFDFDYTLADSARGIIECIKFALGHMGLAAVPEDAARRTIGMSLADTFEALTSISDEQAAAVFSRLFISKADEVMVDSTELFDSAARVIRHLKQQQISLGIVSTKYRCRIEAVLEREGLIEEIDVIVVGEAVAQHKPHPEGLLKALRRLDTPGAGALYVGDSIVDAMVAARAGTPFVAVLSGTTPGVAFEAYQPLEVIERLDELPLVLSRHSCSAVR